MNNQFLTLLQNRIASTSIGPSTARGMGPKGTIDAARDFLKRIDLKKLNKLSSRAKFEVTLDSITNDFSASLPKGAQYWGSSRKFLNIFLRGVFYNRYMCERYDLYKLEPWLEVPLDSHVAKGLRLEGGSGILPRWHTVIGLSPKESRVFQEFAEEVAALKGTYKVHLDLLYWRGTHVINKPSPLQKRRG